MMRQLLKIMNYVAQFMALINLAKAIKRRATKTSITQQKNGRLRGQPVVSCF